MDDCDRGAARAKLFSHVEIQENGCWFWTHTKDKDGYGKVWIFGKYIPTHRLSWALFNNQELPEPTVLIRHQCHNRACFNPKCLLTGSQLENMGDMVAAGRSAKGNRNGKSKGLTDNEVREIRRLCALGSGRGGAPALSRIAAIFNIDKSTVRDIHRRRIWKHVS